MKLPKNHGSSFSNEQRDAWEKMRSLLQDVDEADRRYDALKDSENGTIISTDLARYLDKRYAKDPRKGELRDMLPGWDLAWRYAQNRLLRETSKSGKGKILRLMAGGWAAGKTHAVRHLPTQPDLVWDGTLSDFQFAATVVDHALHQGWKVEIAYIYRNLELALYGAIERAAKEGRAVPLAKLPASHRSSQDAVLKLTTLYAKRKNVSFLRIHNLGKKGAMADPLKIEPIELELNGSLHYLERHEQYYSKAASHLQKDHKA